METSLFWIGIGLLLYGLLLRQLVQRQVIKRSKPLAIFLHATFWMICIGLVGYVISASSELEGPTPRYPVIGAVVGLLGALYGIINAKFEPEGILDLIASDLEWTETTYSAILMASVIMYAVLQAFKIPSGSMEDTLRIGDHLFVNKFIYGVRIPWTDKRIVRLHDVKRGDVVVFEAPAAAIQSPSERARGVKKDFIKRAVALAGDVVEIKNKQLYVNHQPQVDAHPVFKSRNIYPAARLNMPASEYQSLWQTGIFADRLRREQIGDNFGPVVVPPESYFVMGDNRDNSFDSRFWGPVPNRLLKGKAWVVYWPPSWYPKMRRSLARTAPGFFGSPELVEDSAGIRRIQ